MNTTVPSVIRRRGALLLSCLLLMAAAFAAPAVARADNILYCSPNEGNTFNILSGQTFNIAVDCGSSSIVSQPIHGTLTGDGTDDYGDPAYLYTAPSDYYSGPDTFTVFVSSSTGSVGGQGNFAGGSGDETITLNVIATQVAPTPEPGSLMLLGTGTLALAGAGRRRLSEWMSRAGVRSA